MAQYMILIYGDENALDGGGEAAMTEILAAHQEFGRANAAALRSGQALERTESATSVRGDGRGGFAITDGPFVETKEVLGGYYLVDAADLDEALRLARLVPATHGGVEVRPIRTFD